MNARKYTNKILEMHDDGLLDTEFLLRNLLTWMSESDVKGFYETVIRCEDLEDDSDDGDIHDRAWRDGRGDDESALDDFNYAGSKHHY